MRHLLAATIVIALATVALADSEVSGFVTSGAGELSGHVTDFDNKPLEGVVVHIAPKHGAAQTVTTDAKGNYKAVHFAADYAYVYVEAKVKIAGQVVVASKAGDVETVEMHETLPPAVQPKPLSSPLFVPDYSKLAQDKNKWARAWVLVEVNVNGEVTRVNLLDKPGFDLDKIAVREAFKLKFEPARDRANHKVPAMVVWTYEWPPYEWMVEQMKPHQLPDIVGLVPCKPDGRSSVIRNCAKPTMANALTEPWFTRP
jgi:hypothetical protein